MILRLRMFIACSRAYGIRHGFRTATNFHKW